MTDVTRILNAIEQGNEKATDELLPLVYQELRRLAAWRMAQEAPGQTLQPTALVHEAYLRLLQGQNPGWNGRKHFFNAAAEAMRRILVEHAREKHQLKRGGGRKRVPLDELQVATDADSETLLLMEEALTRLATTDPLKADIVKLRFFVGLNNAELAQTLGVSEPTVKRHWAYARAWLYQEIGKLQNE